MGVVTIVVKLVTIVATLPIVCKENDQYSLQNVTVIVRNMIHKPDKTISIEGRCLGSICKRPPDRFQWPLFPLFSDFWSLAYAVTRNALKIDPMSFGEVYLTIQRISHGPYPDATRRVL